MILVTGGAGYIGSHTNKLLSNRGYQTVILDNLVYGHKAFVKWGQFIQGDLADEQLLEMIFADYPIDAVVHFAAFAYVGESMDNPSKYYRNNVMNTIHLLDAMNRHGCQKIVFSSSCTTYGIPVANPIMEEMEQNPISPYGQSKLMIEKILADYQKAYDLKYVVLRYFNAAGGDPDLEIGEWHEPETHIIPIVMEVCTGERSYVKVYGNDYHTPDGTCIRDYIHVCDLAKAHLLALYHLENGGDSESLNLGNQRGYSVKEIIEAAKHVTGKDVRVEFTCRRPGDPDELVGGNLKAKSVLGWKPDYPDIETIIKHAWEWRNILQKVREEEQN